MSDAVSIRAMRGWRSCGVLAFVCSTWVIACSSPDDFFHDSDGGAGRDDGAGAPSTAGRSGGPPAGGRAGMVNDPGGTTSGGDAGEAGEGTGGADSGGTGGSSAGMSGSSGSAGTGGSGAGMGGTGSGGISGSGGKAGNGGSGAGAGGTAGTSGTGGTGGTTAGSGGSGGSAGSSGSTAGNSGNAGTAGAAMGGGGNGSPGNLTLSQTQLNYSLVCPTVAQFIPQTITLKNTGGSELTWTASYSTLYFDVTPSTSTLAANAQVTVTVAPKLNAFSPPTPTNSPTYMIGVTTNVPGDVAKTITVLESANGYFVNPPANIAFGDVPVGTSVTKTISVPFGYPGPALGCCSSPDFVTNGVAPLGNGTWSLTFTPSVAGPASVTLTLGAFQSCLFPPNTFTATGKGI